MGDFTKTLTDEQEKTALWMATHMDASNPNPDGHAILDKTINNVLRDWRLKRLQDMGNQVIQGIEMGVVTETELSTLVDKKIAEDVRIKEEAIKNLTPSPAEEVKP